MRSPARPPAAAKAAVASTSSARVTQWIATGRSAACACAIAALELVEAGQVALVEQQLHGAALDIGCVRGREAPRSPSPRAAGAARRARAAATKRCELAAPVGRGRVRHAGDAEGGQAPAHAGQVRRLAGLEPLAQPGVESEQPPGRPPVGARARRRARPRRRRGPDAGRRRRSSRPRARRCGAGCARGESGDERVEPLAIELAGDRLVVADAADPAVARRRSRRERSGERVGVAHRRRAAAQRGAPPRPARTGGGGGRAGPGAARRRAASSRVSPARCARPRPISAIRPSAMRTSSGARAVDLGARDQHGMPSSASTARGVGAERPRGALGRPGARRGDGGALAARRRPPRCPAPATARTRASRRRRAERQRVRGHVAQRQVEQVPAAAVPGGQRRHRGVQSGERVGDGVAAEERRAARRVRWPRPAPPRRRRRRRTRPSPRRARRARSR